MEKESISSVKHSGDSVKAWACMAASGSLMFIDYLTADKKDQHMTNFTHMTNKCYENIT